METQLKSVIFCKDRPVAVNLFGYTTKGIPGLEIAGLGKSGKHLCEKIIFLSRHRRLRNPLRRYFLSVELDLQQREWKNVQVEFLEFPFLLMYWFLCGHLPIASLNDCLACGNISTRGIIQLKALNPNFLFQIWEESMKKEERFLTYINYDSFVSETPNSENALENVAEELGDWLRLIPANSLLESIIDLKFDEIKWTATTPGRPLEISTRCYQIWLYYCPNKNLLVLLLRKDQFFNLIKKFTE